MVFKWMLWHHSVCWLLLLTGLYSLWKTKQERRNKIFGISVVLVSTYNKILVGISDLMTTQKWGNISCKFVPPSRTTINQMTLRKMTLGRTVCTQMESKWIMTFPSVVFHNVFQLNVVASFCLLTAATYKTLIFMKNKKKQKEQNLWKIGGISIDI